MQAEWLWGLAGGLVIGCAAAIYLLVNGRIMGASGILGGIVDGSGRATAGERLAFLAGLVAVPFVIVGLAGTSSALASTHLTGSVPVLMAAGLCVGIGTRLANGCTSGHGVCGISRLSLRGIVATVFYLLGGGLSVLVLRHLLGAI